MADSGVLGLITGQIIGRWGNFFNCEAFGGYTDNLFAMRIKESIVNPSMISAGLLEHEIVENGTPFLGICLGLQLLFESSDETPGVEGLGILRGKILRIPPSPGLKIPHMGWNSLHIQNSGRLFKGIPENTYVYFVHSYYLQAEEEEIVKATTQYSTCIHASVEKGNVFACQFHPEKSSRWGLKILENFAALESGTGKEA